MTEIVPLTENDYESLSLFLVDFEKENPDRTQEFWYRRFQFWWDQNPAFSAATPRGWAIQTGDKIVGFIGLVPSLLQLENETSVVLNSTTWRVLPEFRDKSLSLIYHQIRAARNTLLFNTTPNPVVEKILKILKFDLLPTSIDKEWIYLIDPGKFLRKNAQKIGKVNLEDSPLARFMFKPGALLLDWFQLFRLARFSRFPQKEVRQIEQADGAFDDLWERTRGRFATTNIRNAQTLNWYCFENPDYKKYVFGYFDNSKLLGYMIFHPEEAGSVLRCFDLWYASNHPRKIIRALLQFVRKFARQNSFDAIRIPCFNQILDPVLSPLIWLKTTNIPKKNYYKTDSRQELSLNQQNAYFTLAQGDAGI